VNIQEYQTSVIVGGGENAIALQSKRLLDIFLASLPDIRRDISALVQQRRRSSVTNRNSHACFVCEHWVQLLWFIGVFEIYINIATCISSEISVMI
jgi:hypothetical protein